MKVCLINPPWILPKRSEATVAFPLGIGYVASFLEARGVDVEIIDALALGFRSRVALNNQVVLVGLNFNSLKARIKSSGADVFGITCSFTSQSKVMHQVARIVKEVDSDVPVMVGGAHPSSLPEGCLADENIDFVVKGEGELAAAELIEALAGNRSIQDVRGIHYKASNGNLVYTGNRAPLDINTLPFPAYQLLPMKDYFEASKQGLAPHSVYAGTDRWADMITSRGCPYNCIFCSIHTVWGHKWRARSPENVVDEIELLVEKYKVRHISFEDDNLTLDIKRAEAICEEILKRGISITWDTPNGVRGDRLTPSLIKKMKRSGCVKLSIGIESGDEVFLNRAIRKALDLKRVEEIVPFIVKEGLYLSGFFIIGVPGENKKTIKATINYARKLARKGLVPTFFIATPLPATEMYKQAKLLKRIVKDEIESIDYIWGAEEKPLVRTKEYDPQDLLALRRKAYLITSMEMLIHKPDVVLRSFLSLARASGLQSILGLTMGRLIKGT